MGDEGTPPLLNKHKPLLSRSGSHAYDELQSFRAWLKWMFVDQSSVYTTMISWFMYLLFAIIVPFFSYFGLACADCDSEHSRPFDKVVQLSLTGIATLSFLCLSRFVSRYGLRRFLFFDRLCDESETVRKGYTDQLNRSLKILFVFVIPCFVAECAYKIWWYSSGGTRVPFLGNVFVSDLVACILESVSWLYRTVVFFLVCVLFRMICYLQILRLHDFAKVFNMDSNVEIVLQEHLRIRRHLRIISHRYRVFISLALIVITASQFSSLLMTTRSSADLNIFKSGELALCSVSLLAGLLIILRSATRITHKAQAVTSLAAKWHVCATIDSFDSGVTTPLPQVGQQQSFPTVTCNDPLSDTEEEDFEDEEDELDNTKFVPAYAYSTISFQKRQALVTYFENNRAGITVYGWMLDRTTLHTIFGLELSLVLWLLGKTIGIS